MSAAEFASALPNARASIAMERGLSNLTIPGGGRGGVGGVRSEGNACDEPDNTGEGKDTADTKQLIIQLEFVYFCR